jgi:hypothetical protein
VWFTELDDLGRLIQGRIKDLEAAGEIEPPEDTRGPGRFNGYCARACIAYDYLVREVGRGEASFMGPRRCCGEDPEGTGRWIQREPLLACIR